MPFPHHYHHFLLGIWSPGLMLHFPVSILTKYAHVTNEILADCVRWEPLEIILKKNWFIYFAPFASSPSSCMHLEWECDGWSFSQHLDLWRWKLYPRDKKWQGERTCVFEVFAGKNSPRFAHLQTFVQETSQSLSRLSHFYFSSLFMQLNLIPGDILNGQLLGIPQSHCTSYPRVYSSPLVSRRERRN